MPDLPVLLGGPPIRTQPFPAHPRALGGELEAIARVLAGDCWLDGEVTQLFEANLAQFLDSRGHIVAVNSGGMALQIALRALGIEPGDEVLMRVDTCVADAYSVFNAGGVPLFLDVDPETANIDWPAADALVGPRTKALIAVHMWGRPEDLTAAQAFAGRHGLGLIDDACLALGARWDQRPVGTFGDLGVFSFGWLKPLQAGGGGAVFTRDEETACRLRTLRAWGDTEGEYGRRDQEELGWNGRLPEIVAAVLTEQLKGYPALLETLRRNAAKLEEAIAHLPGLASWPTQSTATTSAHTKFSIRVDEPELGFSLDTLAAALEAEGVPDVWHAAFEPLTALTFFAEDRWRAWAHAHPDHRRVQDNYARSYDGAEHLYRHGGITLGRNVLLTDDAVDDTAAILARICKHAPQLAEWERTKNEE
ncbi:MAG: DegT/DnrJ/EryC1/StrS family aminotransferase [FCB group bacterium]|jgi:dTDP-4-amino-4,6-dideoxygalactose transaminase|nr:DegT/DnrJ/EryC1/StrS family aminotransferase [FCB group bacterium]